MNKSGKDLFVGVISVDIVHMLQSRPNTNTVTLNTHPKKTSYE